MFKKTFLMLFILFILSEVASPQWGLLRRIGAGGGIHFGILNPSLNDLNNEFKKFDLPVIDGPIFGFGGGGNLSLGGLRLGGFGIGGLNENESIRTLYGTNYNSKIRLEYSLGFGTIGYEVYHSKKFSTNLDLGIGGGSLNIFLSDRTSNSNSWDESLPVQAGTTNITRKLSYSFFSLQPSINFEYIYGNFLKLFISGDYMFIVSGKWSKDDELTLTNVPKMNFNGFSLRFGIYTGLFF